MWMLKLKGGLELTEKELGVWDNIRTDSEIEALGVAIDRGPGQPPYVIDVRGYTEICCAKMAQAAPGGAPQMTGYCIYCVRGDEVTEFKITTHGIALFSYSRDKLTLRLSSLRRMVNGS